MMMDRTRVDTPVVVTVGFAAVSSGSGVAYAALRGSDGSESLVRVGFRCRPLSALCGRDVSYAAVASVARDLLRRGVRALELRIGDAELAADLAQRRMVPNALTIPYVALGCTLNRFRAVAVHVVEDRAIDDLTARARVDVSLNVAA